MDAEHRHELKANELAEGLKNLPQWIKDNANTIIGIVLIAAALITWPMFKKMANKKELAEATTITNSIQMMDQDIVAVLQAPADDMLAKSEALDTLLVNADTLLGQASETDNGNLSALARIKAAQAIRTELHLRQEVDAEMLERQIQKAQEAYQQALKSADTPSITAMAEFGLALCSEELGQIDQAAELYQTIANNESYKATVFPTQAQKRLDTLSDNTEVFTFDAVPVVIEEKSTEPPVTEEPEVTAVEEPVEETVEPQADNL
jgi:predicted negative regulator of RcsB-dependent stress response